MNHPFAGATGEKRCWPVGNQEILERQDASEEQRGSMVPPVRAELRRLKLWFTTLVTAYKGREDARVGGTKAALVS